MASYIYFRLWPGFKTGFPFARFEGLDDDEILKRLEEFALEERKKNAASIARRIRERKRSIEQKQADYRKQAIARPTSRNRSTPSENFGRLQQHGRDADKGIVGRILLTLHTCNDVQPSVSIYDEGMRLRDEGRRLMDEFKRQLTLPRCGDDIPKANQEPVIISGPPRSVRASLNDYARGISKDAPLINRVGFHLGWWDGSRDAALQSRRSVSERFWLAGPEDGEFATDAVAKLQDFFDKQRLDNWDNRDTDYYTVRFGCISEEHLSKGDLAGARIAIDRLRANKKPPGADVSIGWEFCASASLNVLGDLKKHWPAGHRAAPPKSTSEKSEKNILVTSHRDDDSALDGNERECYRRDHKWLEWYEAAGEPTYHSHAEIRDNWNALSDDQRGAIAPRSAGRVPKGEPGRQLIKSAIKRARKERDAAIS